MPKLLFLFIPHYRGTGKEDSSFAKERDAKRVKFDKKTGKAVTVTEPKNKPESVCFKQVNRLFIGLLRSC